MCSGLKTAYFGSIINSSTLRVCFIGWLKCFNHFHSPSTNFNPLQPLVSKWNQLQPTSTYFNPSYQIFLFPKIFCRKFFISKFFSNFFWKFQTLITSPQTQLLPHDISGHIRHRLRRHPSLYSAASITVSSTPPSPWLRALGSDDSLAEVVELLRRRTKPWRHVFEFKFEFSACFEDSPAPEIGSSMSSAAELLLNGQICPMKLSTYI